MDDKIFNQLMSGILEMKDIRAGKKKPARVTRLDKNEVISTRKTLKLSQTRFATAFGISVATLRNWEQGHRSPTGPASVLLKVAQRHPRAILETLYSQ